MAGKLYLVATPIGNLEDMTYRAVRVLSEVDVIAAEDTRNSIKLLNHFEIKTPMTSYHEYNKYDKAKVLVEKMQQGQSVAVITDAGTPGISDPGEELVRQALAAGLEVTPVPGLASCTRRVSASTAAGSKFTLVMVVNSPCISSRACSGAGPRPAAMSCPANAMSAPVSRSCAAAVSADLPHTPAAPVQAVQPAACSH